MANKMFGHIKANSTDVTITVVMRNANTGKAETGIVFGDIDICYWRQGAASPVSVTPAALATLDATHADGGWIEVCDAHMKGVYRLDVPDAAFAEGVDFVEIGVSEANVFSEYKHMHIEKRLSDIIDDSYTHEDILKLLLSLMAGKTIDSGTSNPKFRDTADGKDRLDITLDASGNRTTVATDIT